MRAKIRAILKKVFNPNGKPGQDINGGWIFASLMVLMFGSATFYNGPLDPYFDTAAKDESSGGVGMLFAAPFAIALLVYGASKEKLNPYRLLIGVLMQSAGLIMGFAGAYSAYGLDGIAPPIDRPTSLYFSIVTWTTLGYGDMRPSEDTRLLAALEALLGYTYLGLMIGTIMFLISRSANNK